MALRQLSASTVVRLMRGHKVTIRQLAARMNITMKRVREVRAQGVKGECMSLDWYEAITTTGLFDSKPTPSAREEESRA
jgi:hypothetical protein